MVYERLVLILTALIGVVIGTYITFKSGNPGYIMAFALLPFAILLVGKARLLLIFVFISFMSGLRIPFLPGQLTMFQILALVLGMLLLLARIINKRPNDLSGRIRVCIIAFGLILIFTMMVRGAGFKMLGDYKWGGTRYLSLFITMLFIYFSTTVKLNVKQWRIAVIGMMLAACLPMLAEMLFLLSKGHINQHYYFFQFAGSTGAQFGNFMGNEDQGRLQSAGAAGSTLFLIPFLLMKFKGVNRIFYIILFAVSSILVGLSGHRAGFVMNLLFLLVYTFVVFRKSLAKYIFVLGVTGFVGLVTVIVIGDHLPFAFQRALSWVPFAEFDRAAELDAQGTTAWRIQVWKDALYEVPHYFWIGKGYTFDFHALDALRRSSGADYTRLWASMSVAYHSGPLSLLIGMGITGLLVGSLILVFAVDQHWKILRSKWNNSTLQRMHMVLSVKFFTMVVAFYLIYGDVYLSFPGFFLYMSILEGLRLSDRALAPVTVEEPKPEQAKPEGRRLIQVGGMGLGPRGARA
ncbi:MAG: O-antigen ligase [Kiritimatiellia bacterium]|jgi:O-antigen ligase